MLIVLLNQNFRLYMTVITRKKYKADFDLAEFVHQYFTLPKEPMLQIMHSDTEKPILEHLNTLWDVLTRKPEKSTNSLIAFHILILFRAEGLGKFIIGTVILLCLVCRFQERLI